MKHVPGKSQTDSESNYDFNNTSLQSLGTGVKYEDPRFQLNLVQKKELGSKRAVIPTTKCERLAYYRAYTSTQSKTEVIVPQSQNINSFLWVYCFNQLFKSWPHGFVHYFFAAYTPEEHMFVSKMVPLCRGIKYLFVIVGFLEMISCVDLMVVMFNYIFFGIIEKNPWNRCGNKTYFDEKYNITIICYEIQEFKKMFINNTHSVDGPFYVNDVTGEFFQIAQIAYYREIIDRIANSWDFSVFFLIWSFVQFLQMHAWKRYFWKALHYSQWGINFVDLCTLVYLMVDHYSNIVRVRPIKKRSLVRRTWDIGYKSEFWATDLAMLAESVTAPPVVHVLTSRSTQEIDPTMDSATMVISNALIYIFRGVLSIRVKVYCDKLVHTELPYTQFNEKSWFYLWPMYWQQFYLGDIFCVLYTIFSMICESLILVVTNLCITETVVYEWPKVRRWQVTAVSTVVGIVIHCYTTIDTRAILWIYGKGIATLAEVLFLYLLYPVGRLVDDYTFHYGFRPTKLKILCIRFVPVFYTVFIYCVTISFTAFYCPLQGKGVFSNGEECLPYACSWWVGDLFMILTISSGSLMMFSFTHFKIYVMYSSFWNVMSTESVNKENSHYVWSWSLMLIPIIVGMLMTMFKYLVIHRAPLSYMIRPVPKWGPREFSVRQLRKQFDSRSYIDSSVPRLLSRYLLSKKETNVYKVDVRYDYQKRTNISKAVGFGEFNDEKKEKTS